MHYEQNIYMNINQAHSPLGGIFVTSRHQIVNLDLSKLRCGLSALQSGRTVTLVTLVYGT